ncbi:MAG: GTP diphosphokinase [Candidatus Jorgensenbacteria bacterium GW2011_GWC1_48_8]|uniref:GTP diphosphokinase n=2 Tax=Candidatus Joergenseniibacteriota TaxID=1752739 RepID=A0A0G1XXY8_9BACT|nr:MAG: GTP diphosphokinase [Candidatus Jorgensenbacteria bacterium GW2011_GWC1_48_8]
MSSPSKPLYLSINRLGDKIKSPMNTSWFQKYPENGLIKRAYAFAEEAHKDVKRESGDPYITHSLSVAETVHKWGLDEASVAAALLHDVVEDTNFTLKNIDKQFGKEVAFLVDGLTKLKKIQYPEHDPNVETLRKFIISFSRDLRVVIIKLADRWHNMRTLKFLPEDRQKRIAWETSEIYAPLAYRLGMQRLSGELEDLAFPYFHPEEYLWLLDNVKDRYEERESYARKIKPIIRKNFERNGIKVIAIDSRAKRYSSLYKKLQRYDMDLDKIYDLVALRIVVKTIEDCYAALGVIHKLYPPLPGRIKDYIARPKPNGYQSLHTTVFALENIITEFQVRTAEMHEVDELGIAAHWAYEQIKNSKRHSEQWKGVLSRKELLWVEQLRNWQKSFSDKELIESIAVDFFKDRIFVITPQNDVIDLPAGATPVDFAYRIHSDVGNNCVGAKVNGKIVPLNYELQSGDIVEIMTQKTKKPSEDWLRFIKTSLARSQIKNAIKDKIKTLREKSAPAGVEFKIVNQDRPGFLKDVTAQFDESKINIGYLSSETDKRGAISAVTVRTAPLTKSKLEQILVKIKKIAGTKEVNYKFNR